MKRKGREVIEVFGYLNELLLFLGQNYKNVSDFYEATKHTPLY